MKSIVCTSKAETLSAGLHMYWISCPLKLTFDEDAVWREKQKLVGRLKLLKMICVIQSTITHIVTLLL